MRVAGLPGSHLACDERNFDIKDCLNESVGQTYMRLCFIMIE